MKTQLQLPESISQKRKCRVSQLPALRYPHANACAARTQHTDVCKDQHIYLKFEVNLKNMTQPILKIFSYSCMCVCVWVCMCGTTGITVHVCRTEDYRPVSSLSFYHKGWGTGPRSSGLGRAPLPAEPPCQPRILFSCFRTQESWVRVLQFHCSLYWLPNVSYEHTQSTQQQCRPAQLLALWEVSHPSKQSLCRKGSSENLKRLFGWVLSRH